MLWWSRGVDLRGFLSIAYQATNQVGPTMFDAVRMTRMWDVLRHRVDLLFLGAVFLCAAHVWPPSVALAASATESSAPPPSSNTPMSTNARAVPSSSALPVPPGYFVVAHGKSQNARWTFGLEPLEGRMLVSACVAFGESCVEPRIRELKDSGWIETPELLRDFGILGRVDLGQPAKSPWRWAARTYPRIAQYNYAKCPNGSSFEDSRILAIMGQWPDNTWALLKEIPEMRSVQLPVLYRWIGGRFSEVYRAKQVGDSFELFRKSVAWQRGVAVLELLLTSLDSNTSVKHQVVAYSPKGRTVLTELPQSTLSIVDLARLGDTLVLVTVTHDGTVELRGWTSGGVMRRHRVRSVNSYSSTTFNDTGVTVVYDAPEESYEAVDLAFKGTWRELGRRKVDSEVIRSAAEINQERLFPASLGFYVERAWSQQGHLWLAVGRSNSKVTDMLENWLLTDWAPPSTWELDDKIPRTLPCHR